MVHDPFLSFAVQFLFWQSLQVAVNWCIFADDPQQNAFRFSRIAASSFQRCVILRRIPWMYQWCQLEPQSIFGANLNLKVPKSFGQSSSTIRGCRSLWKILMSLISNPGQQQIERGKLSMRVCRMRILLKWKHKTWSADSWLANRDLDEAIQGQHVNPSQTS